MTSSHGSSKGWIVLFAAASIWFFSLGWSRAGGDFALEPDSAEYLIGARSLALGLGYRDLTQPSEPRLGRPPGTSFWLIPSCLVRPDARLAQIQNLLATYASVLLVVALAWPLAGKGEALALGALLLFNPLTAAIGSRLASEPPFLLFTMAALAIIGMLPTSSSRRSCGIALSLALAALLVWAEKTRTQGWLLFPALIPLAFEKPRQKWAIATLVLAFAGSLLLDRTSIAGGSAFRYYGGYVSDPVDLKQRWSEAIQTVPVALKTFASVLAPGAWPDPRGAGAVFGNSGMETTRLALGAAVASLCVAGMAIASRWPEFRGVSLACLIYTIGTGAVLCLWPHREGRLLWPVLFPSLPFALCSMARFIPSAARRGALVVACAALVFWTVLSRGDPAVDPNPQWKRAARWLCENAGSADRVVTDRKPLLLLSQRFGEGLSGSALSLRELNQRLFALGARYVALSGPTNDPRWLSNPAFTLRPAASSLPTLFSIEPNTSGVASDVVEAVPEPKGEDDSDGLVALGHHHLRLGRWADAIDCFQKSSRGFNADAYRVSRVAGMELANRLLRAEQPGAALDAKVEIYSEMAHRQASAGYWSAAQFWAQKGVDLDPGRVDDQLFLARIARRMGNWDKARRRLDRLWNELQFDVPDGVERRAIPIHAELVREDLLLALPKLLESPSGGTVVLDGRVVSIDPNSPSVWIDAAELFQKDGQEGVGLDLLRRGVQRIPDSPLLRRACATAGGAFGYFEEALAHLEKAQTLDPTEKGTAEVAHLRELIARRPRFPGQSSTCSQ